MTITLIIMGQPASAQFVQQTKLVGSGAIGSTYIYQGKAVAVSADGNTALVGGSGDDDNVGAAWVFTRSGNVWSQQAKLVPTGYSGTPTVGYSVALSADGNTAILGAPSNQDSNGNNKGAAWVFTRSGGVWTQQAALIAVDAALQEVELGDSVALSADGNTALVGGVNTTQAAGACPDGETNMTGAAWVFTRNGSVWTQQTNPLWSCATGGAFAPNEGRSVALSGNGNTAAVGAWGVSNGAGEVLIFNNNAGTWSLSATLVGTGAVGQDVYQGWSVALSGDGNTLIEGGYYDNSETGAAWVFIQSGGAWTQQGAKLVGTGQGEQGYSVSLSDDGNIAALGSYNATKGGALVFSRNGGVWSQQGPLLTGTGGIATATDQGASVALSTDGNTLIDGGPGDNTDFGAAWVFVRANPTNSHDFNDDGMSDILWEDTSGDTAMWLMNGAAVLQSAGVGTVSPAVWSIVGQRDFNADGKADILWHDTSGDVAVWLMNGATISQSLGIGTANPSVWSIVGTGDFFGNGNAGILWRDTSGDVAIWELSGATIVQSCGVGTAPTNWSIAGTGDFNGDGYTDILWHDTAGDVAIWELNGCTILQSAGVGTVNPSVWSIAGTGDFNGDGMSDILWHDTFGDVAIWEMNGAAILLSAGVGTANPSVWSIAQTGDYYGTGTSDILWRDTSGDVAVWQMNGATIVQSAGIGTAPPVWSIQDAGAD